MRFLLLFATLCLLAASLYLVGVFGATPYAAVARLSQVRYYEYAPDGPSRLILALTPARYAALRLGSGALLLGSLLATLGQLRATSSRQALRRLGREIGRAGAGLGRTGRLLTRAEWAGAGALLLAIAGARLTWLLLDPLSPDEIQSFDAFVYEGPAAVASFYPIPNNHVGYNLLAWLMAQLMPGHVRLIMRLPSLLMATGGTALSYALLTHFRNFRVATLATALFSLAQPAVLYAVSGRGYFGQLVGLQLAFFAVVGLVTGTRYRRLAWAVLVASSVAGLYAIPTYAAPLAALGLILGAASYRFRAGYRGRFWGQLALVGGTIGASMAVLYAPVGCVSGWPRLLANRYLAAQTPTVFWGTLRAYVYEAANQLLGPVRPGLVASAVVLGLAPLALVVWRKTLSRRTWWLAGGSWVVVVTPAGLMLLQRVFMPGRTLLYTTYFLYLLAALGADYGARRWQNRWVAWAPLSGLGALVGFQLVAFGQVVPALLSSRAEDAHVARAYRWLRAQPPGPVFVRAPYHEIMFYHYALLDHQPLTLDAQPAPGIRYQYLVSLRGPVPRPAWADALPYRVAYQDAQAIIYTLAKLPAAGR